MSPQDLEKPFEPSQHIPTPSSAFALAYLVALKTMLFSSGASLTVLSLDLPAVWAGVLVMIHLTVLWGIFG
jgi:hypothetical protein